MDLVPLRGVFPRLGVLAIGNAAFTRRSLHITFQVGTPESPECLGMPGLPEGNPLQICHEEPLVRIAEARTHEAVLADVRQCEK